MVILEDTSNKTKKHENIRSYFERNGIAWDRQGLYVGDYVIANDGSVSVDTKSGLQEVYLNLIHDNTRFKKECVRAKAADIKLVILVEQGLIQSIDDVANWVNPREAEAIKAGKRPPVPSSQLLKSMKTMAERYGIEWRFCSKKDTGRIIVEILNPDGQRA